MLPKFRNVAVLASSVFLMMDLLPESQAGSAYIGLAMYAVEFRKSQLAAAGFDMILSKQQGLPKRRRRSTGCYWLPPTTDWRIMRMRGVPLPSRPTLAAEMLGLVFGGIVFLVMEGTRR